MKNLTPAGAVVIGSICFGFALWLLWGNLRMAIGIFFLFKGFEALEGTFK